MRGTADEVGMKTCLPSGGSYFANETNRRRWSGRKKKKKFGKSKRDSCGSGQRVGTEAENHSVYGPKLRDLSKRNLFGVCFAIRNYNFWS